MDRAIRVAGIREPLIIVISVRDPGLWKRERAQEGEHVLSLAFVAHRA